jgi:hypothetical protein
MLESFLQKTPKMADSLQRPSRTASAAKIALYTGTSIRTVHQVISDYNRLGVAAIETIQQFSIEWITVLMPLLGRASSQL